MNKNENMTSKSNSLSERILTAAEKIYYRKGYSNARLDDIAREAGTSVSGIVRLFENKYGVLAALYERAWATVNRGVTAALESCSVDPRERLLTVAVTIWQTYEKSRETVYPILLNTGIADTLILSSPDQKIDSNENLKHLEMIRTLCQECVENSWVDKVYSSNSLREGMYGIIEGVLIGWYQEDWSGSGDDFPDRISIEGGTALIKMLLYGRLDG